MQKESKNEIVLFESQNIRLEVDIKDDTVWLSQQQMADLFETDRTNVVRHINKIYKEEELDKESTYQEIKKTRLEGGRNITRNIPFYNLDMIISVGYRLSSKKAVEFRRWANSVLKEYMLKGYVVNNTRMAQLGQAIQILKRTQNELDSKQVLSVIERYSIALDLLDDYDHQCVERPKGNQTTYVLTYEECRDVIHHMRFGNESDLFGKEKDESFKGSIGNIYQSFGGQELYPTLEEKAAHLLYFVTKNHSFLDGNKRIAATMFLYFLDKNGVLFVDGKKIIDDYTLVALTILIAESRPDEKDIMISIIMNCIQNN